MKDYYIWSEHNLQEELAKVTPGEDIRIYAAEEQQISDDFDYSVLEKCNSVEFLFGAVSHPGYVEAAKIGDLNLWWNFWLFKAFESMAYTQKSRSDHSKLFISLNSRPHEHRCILMDELHRTNLANHGILSWHELDVSHYDWKYWTPRQLTLKDDFSINFFQHILPPEYDDAVINLVSESTTQGIFITEKTWHAILAAKPFVVVGGKGFHDFLQKAGFELYNELFNYEFDGISNDTRRIKAVCKNLERLSNHDYTKLYKSVEDKCFRNQRKAFDMIRNQKDVPQMALESNYYCTILEEAKCKLGT